MRVDDIVTTSAWKQRISAEDRLIAAAYEKEFGVLR